MPSFIENAPGEQNQDPKIDTFQFQLWNALWFIDQIGLAILVATFFLSRHIYRYTTIVNYCIVGVVVGVISSLLFYTGHQTGGEPPLGLCMLQATLKYASSPMSAVATLMVFIQARTNLLRPLDKQEQSKWILWMLLLAPYGVFIATVVLISTGFIGNQNSFNRARHGFYCSMQHQWRSSVIAIFSAITVAASIILIAQIGFIAYRKKYAMSGTRELNHVIRICLMGIWYSILGGCAIRYAFVNNSPNLDLAVSSTGVVQIILFGTARDVLAAWYRVLAWK